MPANRCVSPVATLAPFPMSVACAMLALSWLFTGCSKKIEIPEDVLKTEGIYGTKLVDCEAGRNHIIVYSCTVPLPRLIRENCLKGRALTVLVWNPHGAEPILQLGGAGEANWDCIVDYSGLGSGILRYTQCTFDPREGTDTDDEAVVPLYEEIYTIKDDGTTAVSRRILLKPEELTPQELGKIEQEILNGDAQDRFKEGELEELGARIRNYGVKYPQQALIILGRLGKVKGVSTGEILRDYSVEVRRIAEIRGN